MSILSRTISAVTPTIISNAIEVANSSFVQWAKESKAVSETFSEDRVKVKLTAEKSRLMADLIQAENSLKKSAAKALPRTEVTELHALYEQMFGDNQPQPTVTTVELL